MNLIITLIPKPDKSYAKQEKLQTIFLMNRDTKVLSKSASGIQQCIKRIIGQALGTVYLLFEVPASHIRVPGSSFNYSASSPVFY